MSPYLHIYMYMYQGFISLIDTVYYYNIYIVLLIVHFQYVV